MQYYFLSHNHILSYLITELDFTFYMDPYCTDIKIISIVFYCRYFVPYVHIGKFVSMTFKDADSKLPVMCIGITSGIGRLVFGYIADLPKVNRILLQQVRDVTEEYIFYATLFFFHCTLDI